MVGSIVTKITSNNYELWIVLLVTWITEWLGIQTNSKLAKSWTCHILQVTTPTTHSPLLNNATLNIQPKDLAQIWNKLDTQISVLLCLSVCQAQGNPLIFWNGIYLKLLVEVWCPKLLKIELNNFFGTNFFLFSSRFFLFFP